MTNENIDPPQRSNTTLWLLLASFLVPAIAAYGIYFFGDKPDVASNGQLISPLIDIEEFKLTDQSGELINKQALTPKWRLYYFVSSNCNEKCQKDLYNMRQLNLALGKNQDRVEHVIVHLDEPVTDFKELISAEHQQAVRVYSKTENISKLSELEVKSQSIYLVDPLGNVMMKFSNELTPKLILKDINKLLKISRIG